MPKPVSRLPPPNRACRRVDGWRGTACAGIRAPLRETGCVLFHLSPSEPLVSLSISSGSPVVYAL